MCLVITQAIIMSSVVKGMIVCEKINQKNTIASDCNVFVIFSTQIALQREVNVSIS